MKIYNTTKWEVSGEYSNKIHTIQPESKKEVYQEVAEHLARTKRDYGLVMIDYDDQARKQYATEEEYEEAKRKEGLSNLITFLTRCLHQEEHFPLEVSQKNSGSMEMSESKVPYFKERLEEAKSWLMTTKDKVNARRPLEA